MRRLRNKTPALVEELTSRFREHHAFLARMHLNLIDQHTAAIVELTERIEVVIEPFRGFHQLICSIPGISTLVADVITAETGADMTRFPTAGLLASWAGVCPGHHEPAGWVQSIKTRPGNHYLKGAFGTAAMAAARYRRLSGRIGKAKAIVATDTPSWSRSGTWLKPVPSTRNPGADYYNHLRPDRAERPSHPPTRVHGLYRHPRSSLLTETLAEGIFDSATQCQR